MNDKIMKSIATLIILILILGTTFVYASDVSNAEYMTTIEIINTGTAITDGVAVFTLSTADMIDGNLLSSTANDCAMLTGTGGSDIAFQPSVNSSYPWCTFINAIGANGNLNQYLYHKNATGGSIRYFPGNAGMTTIDSATLELSDNYSVTLTNCWLNTDNLSGGYMAVKPQSFELKPSDNVTGNIIARMFDNTAGLIEYYDGSTDGTFNIYGVYWIAQLFSSDTPFAISNVQIYQTRESSPGTVTFSIKAVDNDNKPTGPDLSSGSVNADAWEIPGWSDNVSIGNCTLEPSTTYALVFKAPSGDAANKINWYYDDTTPSYSNGYAVASADSGASWTPHTDKDTIFRIYGHDGLELTATGINSGEMTITASANSDNFTLTIDSDIKDTIALSGLTAYDNDNDWIFASGGSTLYLEELSITIGGNLQQQIEWEYDTTFTDSSGNSHDSTPTFRTSSSDADMSAEAQVLSSLLEASTPSANVTGGWTMVSSVPTNPGGLYDEGGYDFPGGSEIRSIALDAGQDVETWLFVAAYGLALIALIVVFSFTHSTRLGRRGSLLLSCIAAMAVLIYFYNVGTIPGWTLIPFGILSLLLIAWRRSPSPVD